MSCTATIGVLVAAFCIIAPDVRAMIDLQIGISGFNGSGMTTALGSLIYTRPIFELGVEDLNREYNGSIKATIEFLTEDVASSCLPLLDNVERMVAKWYYKSRRPNAVPVLVASGTTTNEVPRLAAHVKKITL